MRPGRNGILPLKGSVTDAQLVRTPSHLFHGSLHCILSDRVPLARGEYHRPCHLGTLPAGRCHPLLQVRHRPLFCMVRVDPLYPVLSAAARRAQRLLAGLPVPLRRHDHRTELLCPSAHRACAAAYRVYGSDIFARLVRMLYAVDSSKNVCPSIHVLNTVTLMIATAGAAASTSRAAAGCGLPRMFWHSHHLSTMLLKQHSCIDVVLGGSAGLCAGRCRQQPRALGTRLRRIPQRLD